MIRRLVSGIFLLWAIGFLAFTVTLPQPVPASGDNAAITDAVIVPTGGAGRIARGLDVLDAGAAKMMLVSGVDREVKPGEFAAEFKVAAKRMQCCVTLGFAAVDTRSNASEIAQWVEDNKITSLRLVTTDWHMRRAAGELSRKLPDNVTVVRDAVTSEPSLSSLFLEYHKLLASWAAGVVDL
ncbi:MAG: YdcF family protein [Pseudomonadota bacterium]